MSLCPNKSICGSCGWSEIPYKDQLSEKLAGIKHCFSVNALEYQDLDIIPSPKIMHYRNRMDITIDFQGNFGLKEKGKWWRVIDGHICFIAAEKIDALFHVCREWVKDCGLSYYDRRAHTGLLRYIVIRASLSGETLINVITSAISPDADITSETSYIVKKLQDLAQKTGATTLLWTQNSTQADVSFGEITQIVSGLGYIHENINGILYRIYPNSFFQTNSSGAVVLQKVVVDYAKSVLDSSQVKSEKQNQIVDLYCGAGFFTLALKKTFPEADVSGIEEVEDAVTGALTNAEINDLSVNFIKAKSEEIKLQKSALVIVDPPRAGMPPKMLLNLLDSASDHIIYVSCRYENFVKDYNLLQKKYSLQKCVAVDMFPQTHHVELVGLLSKWK
jgi:23S rRNA (uracil-5-)-methyltransferase RumA